MDTLRQIGGSLLLAMLSVALVVGGISLALAESYLPQIPIPTETQTPTSQLNPVASSTITPPLLVASSTASPPTPSATFPPPPTSCPPPAGWIAVSVQPGETLATLAARYQISAASLSAANCLFSSNLPAGSIVYVPPVPTQTRIPCGPPPGWVRYTVRSGDTLTSLSQAFGVSISQLQFANCMASNQFGLSVGQTIYVPNVPTRTPRATATKTLTPVVIIFPTLTWTASATPPTIIPSSPTATLTDVPTVPPTATLPSPTTPPTATTQPTSTATITAFPTATNTPLTPSQ